MFLNIICGFVRQQFIELVFSPEQFPTRRQMNDFDANVFLCLSQHISRRKHFMIVTFRDSQVHSFPVTDTTCNSVKIQGWLEQRSKVTTHECFIKLSDTSTDVVHPVARVFRKLST